MDQERSRFPVVKSAIGVVVLALCIYAMGAPPIGNIFKFQSGTERRTYDFGPDVRYVIRMVPGFAYMPGTRPTGFGEPLRAFDEVAAAFAELYPDTRIVFEQVPMREEYITTQLIGGTAPDIVMSNVEDVWQDLTKGWYLPLTPYLDKPNPYVPDGDPGSREWWDIFRYQAITRGKVAPDGHMYAIPLDMVETAIYYNKSKFEELGLSIPETWEEYMAMQEHVINEGRYSPTLLSAWNFVYWGTDLVFDQLYFGILDGIDIKQIPEQEQYFEGYLDWDELFFLLEKGFFTREDPRWREMFRLLKEWRGMSTPNIATTDFRRMFLRQEGLMLWTANSFTTQMRLNPDVDFEWDVFYFPPMTEATSPFAVGTEMCVIGGVAMQYIVTNSAVRDVRRDRELPPQEDLLRRAEESERLQRVVSWLQFMTLPENAERIVNESMLFIPNIEGTRPHPSMAPFEEILERRYTTTKWTATYDLRFREFFNRIVTLYLLGGFDDKDAFLDQLEANHRLAGIAAVRRTPVDFEEFERRWQELAPLRADFIGLPPGALDGPPPEADPAVATAP